MEGCLQVDSARTAAFANWLVGMIAFVQAMTPVPFVQSILQTTSLSSLQCKMLIAGALLASIWIEVL